VQYARFLLGTSGLVYDFVACLSYQFSKYEPNRKSARIFVSKPLLAINYTHCSM